MLINKYNLIFNLLAVLMFMNSTYLQLFQMLNIRKQKTIIVINRSQYVIMNFNLK